MSASPEPKSQASKRERSHLSLQQRLLRINAFIHEQAAAGAAGHAVLDSMALAELGHLSPSHGHRVYASVFGESMAATCKRLRLHWAAADLVHGGESISHIAARSGYPSVPSFTRTFAEAYGMPPARYRSQSVHEAFRLGQGQALPEHPVRLAASTAFTAFGLPHTGSYMGIGRSFDALFAQLGFAGLLSTHAPMRCVAFYLDDPFETAESELSSLAAVVPTHQQASAYAAAGLKAQHQMPGPHAVLRYQGPYDRMHLAYDWLFGSWLPASGHEAADAPVWEDYLNSPRDTAPTELLTDIWLPLR